MITIETSEGRTHNVTYFTFAGGEVQTKVEGWDSALMETPEDFIVVAHLSNSDDLISLMQVSHKLSQCWPAANSGLELYYTPYAQQDRMCEVDETLACKVFAQMVNSLGYEAVILFDCHSDVMPALINHCHVVGRNEIIGISELATTLSKTDCILVSPDAGALKSTYKLAKEFRVSRVIRADKVRDTATGAILETVVYCDELNGSHCVITDDCCVGGRTFIELAKALKAKGAGLITLYVTHGIFSNGVQPLLDAGITSIYTTDSRIRTDELNAQLNVINL